MKVFAKPGRIEKKQNEQDRAQLIAVYEACAACELATALAADTFARRSLSPAGLIACAAVCGDTAFRLARLEVPDASRVHDELVACRAACALARQTCALLDDAVARRCADECKRCEEACDVVVHHVGMAA